MRYPTANSKEEFERDWKVDQVFGNPTSYGFHEGADVNLKTGGDTDLGRELMAIAKGKIVYYHNTTHPGTNFGRHLVYKIDGPWGTRWVHYAHLLEFTPAVADVAEGQVIAKLGKSGNSPAAHLHWAIFKVDPDTIAGKIDAIAHNQSELNKNWEDPITFVNKWLVAPAPLDYKKLYEESVITIADKNQQITNLQGQVNGSNPAKAKFKSDLKNYIDSYQI